MPEKARARLESFGLTIAEGDAGLEYCCDKVEAHIRNICHVEEIPEGLIYVAADMAAGEYLAMKKAFSPDELSALGFDLSEAVKSLKIGDTDIAFASGEGSSTDEERLDAVINALVCAHEEELITFRRLKW